MARFTLIACIICTLYVINSSTQRLIELGLPATELEKSFLIGFEKQPQYGLGSGPDSLCTGSLIADNVILTARHCVTFKPGESAWKPATFTDDTNTYGLLYPQEIETFFVIGHEENKSLSKAITWKQGGSLNVTHIVTKNMFESTIAENQEDFRMLTDDIALLVFSGSLTNNLAAEKNWPKLQPVKLQEDNLTDTTSVVVQEAKECYVAEIGCRHQPCQLEDLVARRGFTTVFRDKIPTIRGVERMPVMKLRTREAQTIASTGEILPVGIRKKDSGGPFYCIGENTTGVLFGVNVATADGINVPNTLSVNLRYRPTADFVNSVISGTVKLNLTDEFDVPLEEELSKYVVYVKIESPMGEEFDENKVGLLVDKYTVLMDTSDLLASEISFLFGNNEDDSMTVSVPLRSNKNNTGKVAIANVKPSKNSIPGDTIAELNKRYPILQQIAAKQARLNQKRATSRPMILQSQVDLTTGLKGKKFKELRLMNKTDILPDFTNCSLVLISATKARYQFASELRYAPSEIMTGHYVLEMITSATAYPDILSREEGERLNLRKRIDIFDELIRSANTLGFCRSQGTGALVGIGVSTGTGYLNAVDGSAVVIMADLREDHWFSEILDGS